MSPDPAPPPSPPASRRDLGGPELSAPGPGGTGRSRSHGAVDGQLSAGHLRRPGDVAPPEGDRGGRYARSRHACGDSPERAR